MPGQTWEHTRRSGGSNHAPMVAEAYLPRGDLMQPSPGLRGISVASRTAAVSYPARPEGERLVRNCTQAVAERVGESEEDVWETRTDDNDKEQEARLVGRGASCLAWPWLLPVLI